MNRLFSVVIVDHTGRAHLAALGANFGPSGQPAGSFSGTAAGTVGYNASNAFINYWGLDHGT